MVLMQPSTTKSTNQSRSDRVQLTDPASNSHTHRRPFPRKNKMSNPALDLASTLQSASLNRAPSPTHDLNPSTSASTKQPVTTTTGTGASTGTDPHSPSSASSIPYSTIKPIPRRKTLPPLPDLRFEQSYLASLNGAETWMRVGWITVRDQVRYYPAIFLAESLATVGARG